MANFIARRVGTSDFSLFVDGREFARLVDCERGYVFLSNDEELKERVDGQIEADMSVREMLAVVRSTYEFMEADARSLYEMESAAERAYELQNHYWAQEQTEIDARNGM